jgi:hypothetical protein
MEKHALPSSSSSKILECAQKVNAIIAETKDLTDLEKLQVMDLVQQIWRPAKRVQDHSANITYKVKPSSNPRTSEKSNKVSKRPGSTKIKPQKGATPNEKKSASSRIDILKKAITEKAKSIGVKRLHPADPLVFELNFELARRYWSRGNVSIAKWKKKKEDEIVELFPDVELFGKTFGDEREFNEDATAQRAEIAALVAVTSQDEKNSRSALEDLFSKRTWKTRVSRAVSNAQTVGPKVQTA